MFSTDGAAPATRPSSRQAPLPNAHRGYHRSETHRRSRMSTVRTAVRTTNTFEILLGVQNRLVCIAMEAMKETEFESDTNVCRHALRILRTRGMTFVHKRRSTVNFLSTYQKTKFASSNTVKQIHKVTHVKRRERNEELRPKLSSLPTGVGNPFGIIVRQHDQMASVWLAHAQRR